MLVYLRAIMPDASRHHDRARPWLLIVDAALLSLLTVLLLDAIWYLRYGDHQWDPWYVRALDPWRHAIIFPLMLLSLYIADRRRLPRLVVAPVAMAFACALIELFIPELAIN